MGCFCFGLYLITSLTSLFLLISSQLLIRSFLRLNPTKNPRRQNFPTWRILSVRAYIALARARFCSFNAAGARRVTFPKVSFIAHDFKLTHSLVSATWLT